MLNELFFEEELKKQIVALPQVILEENTMILKEDSFIKEVPLVLEGSVKVFKMDHTGKEIILYHILPGESCILSITSCLNNKQSQAQAIIERKSKLITLPAIQVKEWMDQFPSWRKFVMKLYYNRLEELLTLVDNIAFKQVDHRLIIKLSRLQAEQGDVITITHSELANEIGTAREVVSRLLKHLEIEGKVMLERGSIRILKALNH